MYRHNDTHTHGKYSSVTHTHTHLLLSASHFRSHLPQSGDSPPLISVSSPWINSILTTSQPINPLTLSMASPCVFPTSVLSLIDSRISPFCTQGRSEQNLTLPRLLKDFCNYITSLKPNFRIETTVYVCMYYWIPMFCHPLVTLQPRSLGIL